VRLELPIEIGILINLTHPIPEMANHLSIISAFVKAEPR
jgi:hypothetical protein